MRSSFGRSCATGSCAIRASRSQVVTFDAVACVVESLPAGLDCATPGQVKQLVAMLVEEATTVDRRVASIRLRPAAMPFFEGGGGLWLLRPGRTPGSEAKVSGLLAWPIHPGHGLTLMPGAYDCGH
jgi:hypothetical protein